MNERFACCSFCFEKIGKLSTGCARLWLDLCAVDFEKGVFTLPDESLPDLRFLELWGFVTTTDRLDHIAVRMNGRHIDTEEVFYCCGGCDD